MKKIIWGLVALLVGLVLVFNLALGAIRSPLNQARQEATQMINDNNLLSRIDGFDLFVEDETVYTVSGLNNQGEAAYIFIIPNQGQAYAYYQSSLISKDQARSVTQARNPNLEVTKVTLGLSGDQPVYEVVLKDAQGKLGYDVIAAATGDLITQIRTEWR